MNILITNDDGISAEQLLPLIRWCSKLGNVTCVVPKYEQSGKSHGIEIHKAFEAKPVELAPGITAWAVDSSPADCVRFAVLGLHQNYDLVISGVNRGVNIGADIMYSGTVGAACEAVNLGMKAIALSTPLEHYDHAIDHLDAVWAFIQEKDLLSQNDIYNINIPAQYKSIRITRQGGPYFGDHYLALENDMFRACGAPVWEDQGDLTLDTDATLNGYISITPLTTNKTHLDLYQKLSCYNA